MDNIYFTNRFFYIREYSIITQIHWSQSECFPVHSLPWSSQFEISQSKIIKREVEIISVWDKPFSLGHHSVAIVWYTD